MTLVASSFTDLQKVNSVAWHFRCQVCKLSVFDFEKLSSSQQLLPIFKSRHRLKIALMISKHLKVIIRVSQIRKIIISRNSRFTVHLKNIVLCVHGIFSFKQTLHLCRVLQTLLFIIILIVSWWRKYSLTKNDLPPI